MLSIYQIESWDTNNRQKMSKLSFLLVFSFSQWDTFISHMIFNWGQWFKIPTTVHNFIFGTTVVLHDNLFIRKIKKILWYNQNNNLTEMLTTILPSLYPRWKQTCLLALLLRCYCTIIIHLVRSWQRDPTKVMFTRKTGQQWVTLTSHATAEKLFTHWECAH